MKRVLSFLILLLSIVVIPANVKADIDARNGLVCQDEVKLSNGITAKTCTIGFKVVNNPTTNNQAKLVLTLTNMVVHSITLESDWRQTNQDGNTLTFETTASKLEIGEHKIGTITFYKVKAADRCFVEYHIETTKIERNCLKDNDLYYDKNGNMVSKFEFEKQCEPHKCEVLTDPDQSDKKYYFDDTGKEVEQQVYDQKCITHHYCVEYENKYYDNDGEQTSKETYEKECFKHYCEKIDDTYYDKKGNEVEELEYEKQCLKHNCEIMEDDTRYGKNGNIVDEVTYQKECSTNTCTVLEDGTHFDKEGNITDLNTYRQQCEKIVCEKVGNKYYDKNGQEVSQSDYNISCEEVIKSPQTGMTLPIILLSGVTILGIIGLIIVKRKNKFM